MPKSKVKSYKTKSGKKVKGHMRDCDDKSKGSMMPKGKKWDKDSEDYYKNMS